MKKLITLILIAFAISANAQVYKTVTMALDTPTNVAKLRAGTQTFNLTDSFANYTPLQDGLISGGSATIGTGSVAIDTAYYRINKVNYMSLPRTFTGISNSASGTQYYILIYGKNDNTLDTLQGVQDTIAIIPNKPAGTVSINTVLVGDGGVVSASSDLSGYWKLIGDNNAVGNQNINGNLTINNNISDPTIFIKSDIGAYTSRLNMYYSGAGSSDINAKGVGNTLRILVNDTLISQYGDNYANFYKDINLVGKDFLKNGSKLSANDVDTASIRTVINSFNKSESDIRYNPNLGYTPYNPASYPVNSGGETLGSSANRGNIINQSNSGGIGIQISSTNPSSYASTLFYGTTDINANSSFDFIGMYANSVPKFMVSGLGNVTATSFTGSGSGLTNVVNSITGTTNQVIASGSTGAITLSLPQSIATTSTPQFGGLGIGASSSSTTFFNTSAGTTSKSSFRIPSGVAPTSPVSGDWWSLTTGLRTQTYDGTQTKDVIFDKSNSIFDDGVVGSIIADGDGNLSKVPITDRLTTNVITKTANYTVTLSDVGANGEVLVMADATSGNITITLPVASTSTGLNFIVKKTDSSSNTVTVSVASTIDGASTKVYSTQYSGGRITSNGTSYVITGAF